MSNLKGDAGYAGSFIGNQTLSGTWVFNAACCSTPTSNASVTNKKYVDDQIAGINLTGGYSLLNSTNKGMKANVTSSDGDKACNTTVAETPKGYIMVFINGIEKQVGDGSTTKECYFGIGDTIVPELIVNIVTGDTLRWNGSIAGYQLDGNDVIDFVYCK